MEEMRMSIPGAVLLLTDFAGLILLKLNGIVLWSFINQSGNRIM